MLVQHFFITLISKKNYMLRVYTMVANNKKTFILEDASGKAIGTFTGASPGIAARKAATKGHKDIILRETGVHDRVRLYKGVVEKIDPPKEVMIGGKMVLIAKESKAKFIKVEMTDAKKDK
ncbi:chromosomal protein MC1a [Paramecium bursaria Chlorella virus Can18-4]|nr:chromosomal protein MC1a [Paramecium bursaria Chlorella virus Can18-4]